MTEVVVVGSFMKDLIAYVPRRPQPGETVKGHHFLSALGGKGFNQALAAAKAGCSVAMVGMLGEDDFGREFLEALTRHGVDRSGVRVTSQDGTGVGLPVVEDGGDNAIVVIPRANSRLDTTDVDAARGVIESADVLLLQLEVPAPACLRAAELARSAGGRVVVNAAPMDAGPTGLARLTAAADYLVANEVEGQAVARGLGLRTKDVWEAASGLVEALPHLEVIITLGGDGVLIAHREGIEMLPAYDVAVRDTVGAGDAFCGYLAAELSRSRSSREAVATATAAGALTVTAEGSSDAIPTRAAVDTFLASDPRPRLAPTLSAASPFPLPPAAGDGEAFEARPT